MGSAMSVKDADERFAARTTQVVDVRNELAACFAAAPQTAQMDTLLAKARDLLEALDADMKTIEGDLGPDYDLVQFRALADQIRQVMDSVESIPFIYLYEDLVRKLPPQWLAVKGNGVYGWFRGTSIDNALTVLEAGHFDSNYTRTGAYFGKGTYFTPTYDVAEQYGECVFGMNNPGVNILRVRQIKPFDGPPGADLLAAPPETASSSDTSTSEEDVPRIAYQRILDLEIQGDLGPDAARRIRDSGNAGKMLTTIAKEQEYDAVEFLESDEGHILVVLKDLPVTAADVVFIKVF